VSKDDLGEKGSLEKPTAKTGFTPESLLRIKLIPGKKKRIGETTPARHMEARKVHIKRGANDARLRRARSQITLHQGKNLNKRGIPKIIG